MRTLYTAPQDFTIISGGQTGADRAALDWAIAHLFTHAGWCPQGRKAEDGIIPEHYRLKETPGEGYLQRNRWNVRDSDATLIFTLDAVLDGGSRRTAQFAQRQGKPWLHMHRTLPARLIAQFLADHAVKTLNVAGKRESVAPGIGNLVWEALSNAISHSTTTSGSCHHSTCTG